VRTRPIGGEAFSVVGLGGYELGSDPGWAGAREVIAASIEAGVDWIDTAEEYHERQNELVVAAALRDVGGHMKISSKVSPAPDGSGFEPEQIAAACAASRERLGVDRIDLYFLHYPPGDDSGLEESWAAIRRLVDDDAVARVGLSNFDRSQVERCQRVGPVDALQEGLSPIDHLETRELARWCREQGIAVVTYEPLANGMLAGAIHRPEDLARVVSDDYTEWGFFKRLFAPGRFERSEAVRDGMQDVADRIGCSLPELALAWNLHQDGVTATLAGTTSAAHARSNAAAGAVSLSVMDLEELEALIPLGPTFDTAT
jgi:aryl-alcohol dehydrogenase-like predicted oxidoreductase